MSKFATDNEINFDTFYTEMCLAIKRQHAKFCTENPDAPLSKLSIKLDVDGRGHDDQHRTIMVIAGNDDGSTRIEFTRCATGMYYRGANLGERRVVVQYGSWRSKNYPQLKSGEFSYEKIAMFALQDINTNIAWREKDAIESANDAVAYQAVERLREKFDTTARISSQKNALVRLRLQNLTETQVTGVLNYLDTVGVNLNEL